MDARELARRSSAVTLSDMEVFLFPELLYALVLANLLSPRIWRWREDPWFAGMPRLKPYRRILRLKQYIMDRYAFNLDLETWGLTTKERELARFDGFVDEAALAQSNALFGYEGDRYYFDIDIRTHFGLDRYTSNVIPYWKTETVEAMDAFVHKPGYTTGAGECVSLATLYAAALYAVAGIPLADVFLLCTPLHSQVFVDLDEGILINNRRLLTKTMWFNGSALSGQARRALEHERVTIVSHLGGHIHTLYPEATIDPAAYARFDRRLRAFLRAPLTCEVLGNFLRQHAACQGCFLLRCPVHGLDHYIGMDRVFAYERNSSYRATDGTREKLLAEIAQEEFTHARCPGKIVLNDVEAFVRSREIDLDRPADVEALKREVNCSCVRAEEAIDSLIRFCQVEPRLPSASAVRFVPSATALALEPGLTRDEIHRRVAAARNGNAAADLAWYAFRDLGVTEALPFLTAALQRSPVCLAGANGLPDDVLVERVAGWPNESIYEEPGRLAQPDEVWNYGRGDGLERALLLAAILRERRADPRYRLAVNEGVATLSYGGRTLCAFPTGKAPRETCWDLGGIGLRDSDLTPRLDRNTKGV
jgi:hypothetical protein